MHKLSYPTMVILAPADGPRAMYEMLLKNFFEGMQPGADYVFASTVPMALEQIDGSAHQLFVAGTDGGRLDHLPDLVGQVRAASPRTRCLFSSTVSNLGQLEGVFDGELPRGNPHQFVERLTHELEHLGAASHDPAPLALRATD